MKAILILNILISSIFASEFYYEYGKKVKLDKANQTRALDSNITYYKNRNNQIVGVKNEIIIKCKSDEICLNLIKKYNFSNTQKLSEKFFLIILKKEQNVFKLSSKLYHEDGVILSHPNFVKKRFKR